jgi:glycine hydroxymethyltransferase
MNGLRLGTPEIVRWGMTEADMPELAALIARGLRGEAPEAGAAEVTAFRRRFGRLHFVN